MLEQAGALQQAAVIAVVAGLADEQVAGQAGIAGIVAQRADERQEVGGRAGVVLLIQAEQRDVGLGRGAPGDRGGDHHAVVGDVIDIGVGIADAGDEADGEVVGDEAVDVGHDLLAVVAAINEVHLARIGEDRRLGDEVDDAAERPLPEQHRGGAAHDLDPREIVRVGGDAGVEAVDVAHAVAELQRVDAADLEAVDAGVAAIGVGIDAGCVADGIGDGDRALRQEHVVGDDGDGLGHLDQRRVGLGAGKGFVHPVAVDGDFLALLGAALLIDGVGRDRHLRPCRARRGEPGKRDARHLDRPEHHEPLSLSAGP